LINLLPDNQKKEIRQEEKLKIVSILGLILIAYLLSLGLLLFLVKGFLDADLEIQKIYYNDKKASLESLKGLEEETASVNTKILKLKNFYSGQTDYTEIFNKLYPKIPADVYLSSISFLSKNDKGISISMQGSSDTREGLNLLKTNLEGAEEDFSDVFFPPESWIKKNNINFSISFNILID